MALDYNSEEERRRRLAELDAWGQERRRANAPPTIPDPVMKSTQPAIPEATYDPVKPESSPPLVPESTTQPPPSPTRATGPVRTDANVTLPDWKETYTKPGFKPSQLSDDVSAAITAQMTPAPAAPQPTGEPWEIALDAAFPGGTLQGKLPSAGGIPEPETLTLTGADQQQFQMSAARKAQLDEESWAWRTGRGIAERGGDILAGLSRVSEDLTGALAKQVGEGRAQDALLGVESGFKWTTDHLDAIQSESYQPKYSDLNLAITKAAQGEFGMLFGFMAEQSPITIADAAVTLLGAPFYLTATAGDFANERAKNDGRDERTPEDYAYGTVAALVSLVADKILLGTADLGLTKLIGKKRVEDLVEASTSSVFRRAVGGGLRAAPTEAVEEAAQEALTTYDTKTGMTPQSIALAAAGGALAGAPAGAAIDVVMGRPNERAKTAASTEASRTVADDGVGADTKAAITPAAEAIPAPPLLLPPPPLQLPSPTAGGTVIPPAPAQAIPTEPSGTEGLVTSEATAEGEPIAPSPYAGMITGEQAAALPPATRQRIEKERMTLEQRQARLLTDENRIALETRKATNLAQKAGALLLTGEREGIPTTGRVPSKENIELLNQLYTNLSDAARVMTEQIEHNTPSPRDKTTSILLERLDEAAVALAQSRVTINDYIQGFDRRAGTGSRKEASPLERAVARFAMIDPLVLKGLGFDPKELITAAMGDPDNKYVGGTDVAALTKLLQRVNDKAKGRVQQYEAYSGNVAESARIRSGEEMYHGRGVRPPLPDAGIPETRVMTRAQETYREATRHPVASPRAGVSQRTARELFKDYQGNEATNPNYGKDIIGITDEQKAARRVAVVAEEAMQDRRMKGYDINAAEAASKQIATDIQEVAYSAGLRPEVVEDVLRDGFWTLSQDTVAAINAAIDRRKTTERPIGEARELSAKEVRAASERRAREEAEDKEQIEAQARRGEITLMQSQRQREAPGIQRARAKARAEALDKQERAEAEAEVERLEREAEVEKEATLAEILREKRETREAAKAEKQKEREAEKQAKKAQAAHEAAGGNEPAVKSLSDKQKRRVIAIYRLKTFKNAVAANLRDGDVSKLQAIARLLWDSRRESLPSKQGLYVYNAVTDEYVYTRNVQPKVDPSQPGRKRFEGIKENLLASEFEVKGRRGEEDIPTTFTYFMPNQVESTLGWRFGADYEESKRGPVMKVGTGFRPFPENENIFSVDIMDQLIEEVENQKIGLNKEENRDIATLLRDQASKEKHTRPSGTRNYNAGERRKPSHKLPSVIKRKQVDKPTPTVKPTETPVVEKPPPNLEDIKRLLELIVAAKTGKPTEEQERQFNSWVAAQLERIRLLTDQIATANSLMDQIRTELDLRAVSNGEMEYPLPDGWPQGGIWRQKIFSEDTDEGVEVAGDVYPGTGDAAHRAAILAEITSNIEAAQARLELYQRQLDEQRAAWRERPGTGGTAPSPKNLVIVDKPDGPEPAPIPGPGGNVQHAAAEGARVTTRKPVDLLASVERKSFKPFFPLDVVIPYGSEGAVTDEQKLTASAVVEGFQVRRDLGAKGWRRSTVNKSAVLVANGTGSGKTVVVALSADAIYNEQLEKDVHPVLIVHKSKLLNNMRTAFINLGLNPDDKHKYIFISYNDLPKISRKGGRYAAVIFDESHEIKSIMKEDATWAPAVENIHADFRVFLTATPTDAPLQEAYYLRYMVQDTGTQLTLAEAQRKVLTRLGLGATGTLKPDPAKYVTALNEMILEAAANNAVTNYSLESISENSPIEIEDYLIDAEAAALFNQTRNYNKRDHLLEHMKVPAMIEQALGYLSDTTGGNEWGVIAVFKIANKSDSLKGTRFHEPAIDRYARELKAAALERGIPLRMAPVLKGEGGDLDALQAKFRSGEYNSLAMTDAKGGTGLDLDDNVGNRPKAMLLANLGNEGLRWIQTVGRVDRAGTKSRPAIHFMRLPKVKFDIDLRANLASKVTVELTASGAQQAGYKIAMPRKRLPGAPADSVTAVDASINEKLAAGPQSAVDMVQAIARNETDPSLAALAQTLEGHPALAGILTTADEGELPAAVQGAAILNQIIVQPGGASAITLLHEATHHITHAAIDSRPDIRARLRQLMSLVPKDAASGIEGVLTNPHEFVAEAFSNPAFQAALRGVKLGNTTLWQRFKDFVRRVVGAGDTSPTVWDAVMELKLLDPGTVTQHGRGDSATQLTTTMYRKISPVVGDVAKAVGDAAVDVKDPTLRALLKTLTLDQVNDSFGRLAQDGDSNYLQDIVRVHEARNAFATQERNKFSKGVLEKWVHFAASREGRQTIHVRMDPDSQNKTSMTRSQYLAELFNISGYANTHFGKAIDDKANAILGFAPRKTPRKPGTDVKRSRSHVFWDLHKPQFDRNLGSSGQDVYNQIAAHFAEEVDAVGTIVAQQFLNQVSPRADGKDWLKVDAETIRDEMKRYRHLTDAELEERGLTKNSLKHVQALLQPGRVPGAYFPLTRFGNYVVAADERIEFTTDEQREALLDRYPGAVVVAKRDATNKTKVIKQEILYRVMSKFETESEANAFRETLLEQLPNGNVSQVMVSSQVAIKEKSSLNPALVDRYVQAVNQQAGLTQAEKNTQINLFLNSMIDVMPEASYANTFRKRKGVIGAALDPERSFSTYGAALSHMKASAAFASQIRKANRRLTDYIHRLEQQTPDLKLGLDEAGARARKLHWIQASINEREANTSSLFTEGEIYQKLNNIGFFYYLVSASYNVINALQPVMMTTPHLAGRFGVATATGAMAKAYRSAGGAPLMRLVRTGFTLTKLKGLITQQNFDRDGYDILPDILKNLEKNGQHGHAALLRKLADRNLIEATVAMDMAQGAKRRNVYTTGSKAGQPRRQGVFSYLTEWMRMAPHITEVMNRSVAAIAAYDLEFNRLRKQGKSITEAVNGATEYAASTVKETQFNYQNINKPPILQGSGLARTLLMFKQHPQHVYYYMISRAIRSSSALTKRMLGKKLTPEEAQEAVEDGRQLAYFVGMHMLAVGAIGGVPEPVKWMLGLLSMLFGDDDEPFNYELEVQQHMSDWLGPTWADVGARGLLALTGADLTGRIGVNNLLLFDTPNFSSDNPDTALADIARIVGGPMASLGERLFLRAPAALRTGNYDKALEEIMPKGIQDILQARRLAEEGFTTYAGRVYSSSNEFTPVQQFMTAIGLSPVETSKIYLRRDIEYKISTMQSKKSQLIRQLDEAWSDPKSRIKAIDRINKWNRDNPSVFRITKNDIMENVNRRRSEQRRTQRGMLVSNRVRPYAEAEANF